MTFNNVEEKNVPGFVWTLEEEMEGETQDEDSEGSFVPKSCCSYSAASSYSDADLILTDDN